MSNEFYLDEFIPKSLYTDEYSDYQLKMLIDYRLVNVCQQLRNRFGPLTINDWYIHGDRNWSGLRTPGSPYYSLSSQHSWGRAVDVISNKYHPEEMRDEIRKHYNVYHFLGVTRIERDVNWLHFDLGYSGIDTLMEFSA